MSKLSLRLFSLLLFFCTSKISIAQESSFEFWPETDIWYRLSPSWRFSTFIPITKYHESQYRDLNIYLQVDYSWGNTKRTIYKRLVDENREQKMKAWMVRGFFMEGWSIGKNEGAYREHMLFAEIHKRIPLRGDFLLSQRIRTDFRWLGDDSNFSYRYRYRIMLEKEIKVGKSSFVPYINVEPYWDSRYSEFTKIRAIGGTTISLGPMLAYEANLTYQYDETYDTPNLFALNVILHVFFESKKNKAKGEN
jgi:hypothetical protein